MDLHTLRSHPHQSLFEHIAAVREATEAILERHLNEGWMGDKTFRAWAVRLCYLHDLGKGNSFFQEYIQYKPNPSHYPKERHHLKAHTLLSLLITCFLLEREDTSQEDLWAVSQAVLCHHGKLRTSEAREQTRSRTLWQDLESDERVHCLRQQLSGMSWEALEAATGELVTAINWPSAPWRKAKRALRKCKYHWEQMAQVNIHEAVDARLRAQMLYSVLLEADKALLAIKEPKRYLQDLRSPLESKEVELRIEGLRNNHTHASEINNMREEARCLVMDAACKYGREAWIHLLALPTGLGKTLSAASWAATMREHHRPESKIVVVMPFLSIIDQTVQEYQRIFNHARQGTRLMASHSLASREYSLEEDGELVEGEEFFLDTWRSEVILTTYDQLLLSMMSPKGKHQMRLHQLCDALIILDELQSVPCRLWSPLQHLFRSLCQHGNTHILAMSATLPQLFSTELFPGERLLELLPESKTSHYFRAFERYTLHLRYREGDELFESFIQRTLRDWRDGKWEGQRLLITLNTRRSARKLRDKLAEVLSDTPLFFLTADVTPKDRLSAIDQIHDLEKNQRPCLVVATQCIEAGVDLDFDTIIRDFAPLDSLVQIAGRCNRHNRRNTPGHVEIVRLIDDEPKKSWPGQKQGPSTFCSYIYDEIHLEATVRVLRGCTEPFIPEKDVRQLCIDYFAELQKHKDTGEALLREHISWKAHIDVSKELRGEQPEQHTFVVQYPYATDGEELGLQHAILRFQSLSNSPPPESQERWARRSELQNLARQIAQSCVTVYARPGFHPEEFGDPCGYFFVLHQKPDGEVPYYTKERGLVLPETHQLCLVF